jgi:hypothetical protein
MREELVSSREDLESWKTNSCHTNFWFSRHFSCTQQISCKQRTCMQVKNLYAFHDLQLNWTKWDFFVFIEVYSVWQVFTRPTSASDFYFHHIWNILKVLVSLQNFGIFFAQITWKKQYFFPLVTCRRRRHWQKLVPHLQSRPEDLESWNFGSRSLLGQLDVLHTQNFKVQVPKGISKTFTRGVVKVFEILLWNDFHGMKVVLSCSKGTI